MCGDSLIGFEIAGLKPEEGGNESSCCGSPYIIIGSVYSRLWFRGPFFGSCWGREQQQPSRRIDSDAGSDGDTWTDAAKADGDTCADAPFFAFDTERGRRMPDDVSFAQRDAFEKPEARVYSWLCL